MNNIDVSIIVVNYFTASLVKDCLSSVASQTKGITYEVLVVDNSCSQDEKNRLVEKVSNDATLLFNVKNYGFGKANNIGAKVARGRYLLFLNSDTLLNSNVIKIFYDFLETHPKAGIVGGNLLDANHKPTHSFVKDEYSIRLLKKRERLSTAIGHYLFQRSEDYNYSERPKRIEGYVCGANLMIRTTLFKEIGGFDEHIFMYGEDSLLCYECIHSYHYEIWQIPTALIIHLESRKEEGITPKKAKMKIDGSYYYFLKAYGQNAAKQYLTLSQKSNQKKYRVLRFLKNPSFSLYQTLATAFKDKLQEINGPSNYSAPDDKNGKITL